MAAEPRRLVTSAASCTPVGVASDSTRPGNGSLKLRPRHVEKPWGRTVIPSGFGDTDGRRVGEIWFEHPWHEDLPLLVKYIFTSDKLSIQVHPDDEDARKRGLPQGKSECWYILDAAPGATVGLGPRSSVTPAELRAAALDGSIEDIIDWQPVAAGDFFFVPAGTIHSIGAGIVLLEIQQTSDVTYRLFNYGRPSELHLDDGLAVSRPSPYPDRYRRQAGGPLDAVLLDGPHFSLVRASSIDTIPSALAARQRWVIPLEGIAVGNGSTASAGECLFVEPGASFSLSSSAVVLVGAAGEICARP
jgi:mannose-6-phosphate isomerase